ncbi:hypothetical protein LZ30DRAFT_695766 [Colletotrichum cereale]|nr:hypothetical protein LZ30DRAFT_695766 [Colletotrichum cereale]
MRELGLGKLWRQEVVGLRSQREFLRRGWVRYRFGCRNGRKWTGVVLQGWLVGVDCRSIHIEGRRVMVEVDREAYGTESSRHISRFQPIKELLLCLV